MHILALIGFIVALVLFVVEAVRTKALVTWGFAVLTGAFILLYVLETSDPIKF